ncbi:MAG: methyl-accepting chemotaxis protein [Mariniblastus sp.]|nr:methyl-accepting chemotaxis protein [Mariniblastus sp.]
MRTNVILIVSFMTSLAAAAISGTLTTQDDMGVLPILTCGLTLFASLTTGWGFWRIHRGLGALTVQAESSPSHAIKTGFSEFDKVGEGFASVIQAKEQTQREQTTQEAKELAEIKKLLMKIDRREGDFDRSGNPVPCANQLQGILTGYGGELDSNVRQAISCRREIQRATEELISGSESQSDSVSQTATVIEHLTAGMMSVCDTAEGAMMASNKAQDKAFNGLQQFEDLIEEMKRIRSHAAARERKMQALGKHTKEIESIVQAIGTLSSRTDLLALNASIESVRAGEHGRGFAIVAEEVRALAEQSASAVQDISRRIEMIQAEAHQSISVATGEHDQMNQVINRVTDTLEAIKDICEVSDKSSIGLIEISQASRNQLKLTKELVGALEQSNETAKQNRSRAEGVLWTLKTLAQCGEQFQNTLQMFRLAGSLGKGGNENSKNPPNRSTIPNQGQSPNVSTTNSPLLSN